MHVVTTNSPGLMSALDALHFPVATTTVPEFGPLPITRTGWPSRPRGRSDEAILQTAE